MGILVFGRLIQGMGGGMLLSLSYVGHRSLGSRPELLGPSVRHRRGTIWGGGSLLGPLIGGAFSGPHLWRGAFWAFTLQAWCCARSRRGGCPRPRHSRTLSKVPVSHCVLSAATLIIAEAGAASGPAGRRRRIHHRLRGGTALLYLARGRPRALVRLLQPQLSSRHTDRGGTLDGLHSGHETVGFWG